MSSNIKAALNNIKPKVASKSGIRQRVAQMLDEMNQFDAMGAADMISVYVRQTLVQGETPDAMRGRVSAVSTVFIGASNELGEFESGMLAAAVGAVPAVVIGGVGTIAVVGLWAWLFPDLRKRDHLIPDKL